MSANFDPDFIFRELAAAASGRRRSSLSWTALSLAAASLFGLIAWEAVVGPAAFARTPGYVAAYTALGFAVWRLAAGWRRVEATSDEVVDGLERLYPQLRGGLSALLEPSGPGLAALRRHRAARWLGRRASELDAALGRDERRRLRRRRMWSGVAIVALAIGVASQPSAARRAATTLPRPDRLLTERDVVWRVTPGNAAVGFGSAIDGSVLFDGPPYDADLVLEARQDGGAWIAEPLGAKRRAGWTWDRVEANVEYRFRFGVFESSTYTLKVEPPVAFLSVEASAAGEPWGSLAGGTLPAEEFVSFRGRASAPIRTAWIQVEGRRRVALTTRGETFEGEAKLRSGVARLWAESARGELVPDVEFLVAAAAPTYIDLLWPDDEPTRIEAAGAWVEVRAGSPRGLRTLRWETDDGRSGAMSDVAGARDTVVASVVPLGTSRAPGDTFRFRIVASAVGGGAATTAWRHAVMADRAAFEAAANAAREEAGREVDQALEEARRAARGERDATEAVSSSLDDVLRAAADSLARSLDRTLADPDLDPALAERLAGARRMLTGASEARLAPSPGLPDDTGAELAARAEVIEAIRQEIAEVERLMELVVAADTLTGLAAAEQELARETRSASGHPADLAERQDEISDAATEVSDALSDSLASEVAEAMDRVEQAIDSGDPAQIADTQEQASITLSRAADGARQEVAGDAERNRQRRRAVDRAGAEVLFLADRQSAVARSLARSPKTSAEQATRVAAQRVVARGLEAALGALVDAIGGRPAGVEIASRLAQAVFSVRYAEEVVASRPGSGVSTGRAEAAAEDAARALALLARAFLLPENAGGPGGAQGAAGRSGAAAAQMDALASAERALADAAGESDDPGGGNPEAAGTQREIARQLEEARAELVELGVDARTIETLRQAVEESARRLDRGLPGARAETELQALARRFSDLGRIVERDSPERRRSETAASFVPAEPPPLPVRAIAPRLDPGRVMAAWRGALPDAAEAAAIEYLTDLSRAGVREPESVR